MKSKAMKGESHQKGPSGKAFPKGKSRGPEGGPPPNSGRAGKLMTKPGMTGKKALISQKGGKKKGPLEAIAMSAALKGKGGYN